jgi:hypothetical protein
LLPLRLLTDVTPSSGTEAAQTSWFFDETLLTKTKIFLFFRYLQLKETGLRSSVPRKG